MRWPIALLPICVLAMNATCPAAATVIRESARSIPIASQADVVVVGGSTGAVAAAVAAATHGAKVYLVAPHPYLGDDMTATLRLWLEPGEVIRTPLGDKLFHDTRADGPRADPDRLPFTYTTDRKPSRNHADTNPPSLLIDGQWGRADRQSLQFEGPVTITADLGQPQDIRLVRVIYYQRTGGEPKTGFDVDRVQIAVSDDAHSWQPAGEMSSADRQKQVDYHLGDCLGLATKVSHKARYVRLAVSMPAEVDRMLLGEVEIVGPPRPQPKASVEPPKPVRPLHVKKTLDEALLAAGVQYLYDCYATDVLRDAEGRPCGVVIANRAGRQAVVAKLIVDATPRAAVARLAGARFRPYPAGQHTFQRVVIGGAPQSAPGMSVRTISPPFTGMAMVQEGETKVRDTSAKGVYPIYEYTLQLPMADDSWAAWCAAEQQARTLTWHPEQQFAADELFEVPPDAMHARTASDDATLALRDLPLDAFRPHGVDRLWVLGGCADISRAAAAKLLRPMALLEMGQRVGEHAAREAHDLPAPQQVHLPAAEADAGAAVAAGEIREALGGVRPVETPAVLPQEARMLPVLGRYDVVVVGGGTCGAPAGIAAARHGAKTLVLEYLHGFGGVGTMGAISSYCAGNRVGFTSTVLDSPKAIAWRIETKSDWWRRTLLAAGAELWCGTIGCGAVVEDGRVCGVVVATPNGRGVVLAKTVVDATGNADVAAAAGAACRYTDAGELAMQGTGLPPRQLGASYANTDFTITDETDLVDVWHLLVFAKNKYPGAFDQGQLVDTRERRMIVGEYTLTVLDEIAGRTYPDTVVQTRGGSYDTHGYTVEPYLFFTHPKTPKLIVNIPFRCMLPKNLEGILVAGLGMSAHRDATPLVRMQADIQNGGYAAGTAAAMAAKSETLVRHIDVRALQQHLVEIGNLTPDVLGAQDSFPLPPQRVVEAVQDMNNRAASAAIVFASPQEALPKVREAFAAASGDDKLGYATALGLLGDPAGLQALLEAVDKTPKWDRGWNYKGMGQFGNAMSPLDTQIVALGRLGDRRALPVILEKLCLLDAASEFSHHRAVALALEAIHDPAAAQPLADLLRRPGMSGHVHDTIDTAIAQETGTGTNGEKTRRESIRELALARALYRCGDCDKLGEQTLRAYTKDLRGHLARHALAVLKEGPPR